MRKESAEKGLCMCMCCMRFPQADDALDDYASLVMRP